MDESIRAGGFNALAIGWYGAPNVGDEVLLEVLKQQVLAQGGRLMVASVDPALTREMHGIEAVDFNNLGEIARALLWADVLIMGGGGIFQDHHPFGLPAVYDPALNDISAYARPALMARQFGVPVIIWGHGVGPLTTPEAQQVVRDIFNDAAAVSVRDTESLELLRHIGVERSVQVGADPGWLYRLSCETGDGAVQASTPESASNVRTLAVVVREWGAGDWTQKFLDAMAQAVGPEWQVRWVAFQANIRDSGATSDLSLIEQLRGSLPPHLKGELVCPSTPHEAWRILSEADAIFSMRLHASILGLLAGKPIAGLEYDAKMARAHAMAGVADDLRLTLSDPGPRFAQALSSLLSGAWRPDPERIALLESSARVHLDLLQACGSSEARGTWNSGHYDWLGSWLQQTIADLRATRARSQLAHEVLHYRDAMLAERDASLEQASQVIKDLEVAVGSMRDGMRALAVDLGMEDGDLVAISQQVADLQHRNARLVHQAGAVGKVIVELLQAAAGAGDKRRQSLRELWEGDPMMQSNEMTEHVQNLSSLDERIRALQIELAENSDELKQRDAYINDKEIYIAQLLERVGELERELTQTQVKLEESRDTWRHVVQLLSVARRDLIRVAVAPVKIAAVWKNQGFRVAMQQIPRRMVTMGRGPEALPMIAPAAPVTAVRPVRRERLLVIAGPLEAHGWPSRASALAKAAERAGFLVRLWSVGAPAEEVAARYPELARVTTNESGLLHEVRSTGTRVLLADASAAGIAAASTARERGAEVILDLASIGEALDEATWAALAGAVSRAISRDGKPEARLPGIAVERLDDAGDNEEFDSYKSYAYPQGFRKHRRNILVFADAASASVVGELVAGFPNDQIHLVGEAEVSGEHVRQVAWEPSTRAAQLAAADVVVVAAGADGVTGNLRQLAFAALLLERPLVIDADPAIGGSRNLHVLAGRAWADVVRAAESVEDYRFVSGNAWLGRAEQLMQAGFPQSVSAVVLIHNNRRIIERCVSTMLEHCGAWLHEIVVVDNQSSDGGAELVEELYGDHPKVKLVRNKENGCSSGRNLGVHASSGEYIAFFDSDQWLTSPSCFAEAIHVLELDEGVGTIGWNAGWFDATRDDLGGAISDYLPARGMNAAALAKGYRDDIGFLGTSGMFIKRELFNRIEGFDTFYDPTCFEDTDICFQVKKAGYGVAFRDLAGVRHQPHQTTGASESNERYKKLFKRNAEYFRTKWSSYTDFFVDYAP